MKDVANNVALGLGVAVLGFAVYKYFASSAGAAGGSAAGTAYTGASVANGAGGPGALLSQLTFPLGSPSGGVNLTGGFDQVYSSTAWNPDAISSSMMQDAYGAMASLGLSTSNQYGFHV